MVGKVSKRKRSNVPMVGQGTCVLQLRGEIYFNKLKKKKNREDKKGHVSKFEYDPTYYIYMWGGLS